MSTLTSQMSTMWTSMSTTTTSTTFSTGSWRNNTLAPSVLPSKLPQSVLLCTGVAASLSILGSLLIFVTYCIVENAKNQTRRLLIYLTISDFLICVGNLLGTIRYAVKYDKLREDDLAQNCRRSDDICVIQSCVTTFASLASFGWTIVIGVHLLTSLVYQKTMSIRARILCHILCWGAPILITTVAAFMNVLGEDYNVSSGPWCWIRGCLKSTTDDIMWMTVTGKGWEILTYFVTANLYIYLKWYMFKRRRLANRRIGYYEQSGSSYLRMRLRDEDEIYVLQWLLLYVVRLWGTIRYGIAIRRLEASETMPRFSTADNVLLHMQSIGDSSHAFFNCILFCVCDSTVRESLLTKLRNCVCCRRGSEMEELIDPALN